MPECILRAFAACHRRTGVNTVSVGYSRTPARAALPSKCRSHHRGGAASNEAAGRIINAINAFIISRRFQDEVAEKRRVDDLENRLNEALELNERYGKRLEEIVASRQGNN